MHNFFRPCEAVHGLAGTIHGIAEMQAARCSGDRDCKQRLSEHPLDRGGISRRTTVTKIAMAIALLIATLAAVPASAGPREDGQYSPGYQDNAYNRHGW